VSGYFRQDFLPTGDGARLHFQVQGDGDPGMVLCDGLGCDGFAWKYLLPELRERFRVVRWHYRGHGKSTVPDDLDRIGMHYTCDDLARVMDAAGLEQAVIFGHSMGVQVALEFHRRYPSRVAGMVLLCGSYGNPLDTFHDHTLLRGAFPYVRQLVERFPHLSREISRRVMKTDVIVEISVRAELNPLLMKKADMVPYFDHLACMDPVAFVRTLAALQDHSAWEHLPHVNVPTLIVGGMQDRFTPVWLSQRMADAIPNSELMLVPGGSHAAPLELPAVITRRIDRFLRDRMLSPDRGSLLPSARRGPGNPERAAERSPTPEAARTTGGRAAGA
jgi:pimeloyl-ACP methyl ester carboxylesterase